jgi:hypothetical protein
MHPSAKVLSYFTVNQACRTALQRFEQQPEAFTFLFSVPLYRYDIFMARLKSHT